MGVQLGLDSSEGIQDKNQGKTKLPVLTHLSAFSKANLRDEIKLLWYPLFDVNNSYIL